MAAETPDMSAITFLIFAWVIISWPFRMPPSSSPMMTSTIAISTSVKPACLAFMDLSPLETATSACYATPVPALSGFQNKGLTCRRGPASVEMPTGASGARQLAALTERFQPLLEEGGFGRIGDLSARQQPAEHDARRLDFIHVFEDEDLHLPRPERHVRRGGVPVDRRGIAARERQVVQPVLGEQGRVREPRPAPVRIEQELLVDELQHEPAACGVADFRVDARRGEQRIRPARVELEERAQPRGEARIVQRP